MLLFVLFGLLLLRLADWRLLSLLFQLPPRITRFEPPLMKPLWLWSFSAANYLPI